MKKQRNTWYQSDARASDEQGTRNKTQQQQLTYKANSVIKHKHVPPKKYRILDLKECVILAE
eukprot:scaffold34668_cov189-Skeletonema_dohrnii-CCMP3373.AAC.3